ncbi:MAG: phospholipid carrier-dependent glycosyltransferase [Rhizobium sp.]|nr:MAG: phospholipid carrier-dependent glycosyltransferase [Rhizobium sp.]
MIRPMRPTAPLIKTSRPVRIETYWLAGAIVMGAALRLAFAGKMAIEHFDEGVYASNFWFGADEGFQYPARHLYAPPLLPAVIEWTMIVASMCGIRPVGLVPMIPSLVAGLATIPSMWWVGRRWFGPSAGIVAAWLVAASDYHASYSRTALTDVPVCLLILWGVYFTWQAIQTGAVRSIILAGVFTALTWWTKYNGWLPLAIGASAAVAWQLTTPSSERQVLKVANRFLMVAALAFLLWSPVLIELQKHGGYSAVASNHAQYVEGLAKWPGNAVRQLSNLAIYQDLVLPYLPGRPRPPAIFYINAVAPAVLLAGILLVSLLTLFRSGTQKRSVDCWPLLAWVCGLTVAVPFYHPYPRLAMPWIMAIWLGTGFVVQTAINRGWLRLKARDLKLEWKPQWLEIAALLWLVGGTCLGERLVWEDHSVLAEGVKLFSGQIKEAAIRSGAPDDEAISYVYGAPAVIFHLRANRLPLSFPVQSREVLSSRAARPTFRVDLRSPGSLSVSSDDADVVSVFRFSPSMLVELDQMQDSVPRPIWTLRLERLRN